MDLVWDRRNPAIPVCQFFTSMLLGAHLASLILWTVAGFGSLASFQENDPEAAHELRCAYVLAIGICEVRHIQKWLKGWPWLLTATADSRRSWAEREDIMVSFGRLCPLCVDKGHGRQVKSKLLDPLDLAQPRWQRVHKNFAELVDTQNDDSERVHAWHRHTFGQDTQLDYMTAGFKNHRAQALASQAHTLHAHQAADPPRAEAKEQSTVRGFRNIKAWYHNFCSRRDANLGMQINPVSKEYWAAVTVEFDALPPERKEEYIGMMKADRQVWKNHCAERRALCDLALPPCGATSSPTPCRALALPSDSHSAGSPLSILEKRFASTISRKPGCRTKWGDLVPIREEVFDSFRNVMKERYKCAGVKACADRWREKVKLDKFARDTVLYSTALV